MSYNVIKYSIGWLFMFNNMVKKMADLSQTLMLSTEAYGHTCMQINKLMLAKGDNAMHCT